MKGVGCVHVVFCMYNVAHTLASLVVLCLCAYIHLLYAHKQDVVAHGP